MKSGETISLGNFRFDPTGPVLRDETGKIVPLRSQSLKVLERLCQTPEEIFDKSVLFDEIWGDTFVTDASLVQCIREICRVLQDGDFELIRTLPRQGYMVVPSETPGTTPTTPLRLPVIAVLPFENLGMAESPDSIESKLNAALADFPELSVVSLGTTRALAKQTLSIREISDQTNADYILTGTIDRVKDSLRVIVELIESSADKVIWTETFIEPVGEDSQPQNVIVEKITATVGHFTANFPPPAWSPSAGDAFRFYLEASVEMGKQTEAGIERAEELARMSVEADPTSPYGYVGLAVGYYLKHRFGLWFEGFEATLRLADEYAEKAVSIAPNNSVALFARALVCNSQGRLEHALACIERCIQLNPNEPASRVACAETLVLMGNIPAAIEQINMANRPGVTYPDWQYRARTFSLWAAGEYEEALVNLNRDPLLPIGHLPLKCVVLVANGRLEEAREVIAKFMQARPNHTVSIERAIYSRKFRNQSKVEQWARALILAGMPE